MKTIKILSLLITIFFSLAANSFAAQISGMVYDDAGNPITGGGRVEVYSDNSGMYPPFSEAYLNLDGTYIIQGLNAGSYYLLASSNGNHVTEWWADPASTSVSTQAQAVTVTEGEIVTGIDFQLDTGAQISGTVFDSSGNPVSIDSITSIAAFTGDPCGMYTTVSSGGVDIDGNYTIQRLPAGSYYLRAYSHLFSSEWWAGSESSPDCSQAQAVTVASSETVGGMDFQLITRAQISGTVYDDAGNPITGGGKVEVYSDNSGMYPPFSEAYLNLDGTYIIQGLNAGSYYLLASSNGNHVTEWWADPASTSVSTQAQAVTVTEGEIVAVVNFQLDTGAQISGTVLDSSGNPVSIDSITSITAYTGDPCGAYSWVSSGGVDIDGNYTIQRLPAGSYYLRASSHLFSPEWWAGSESSPDCSQAQAVTVALGETDGGMDFQLSTRAQITGTVYDDAGNPITGGGRVEVYSDNSGMYPPFSEAYLNLDGTYIIQGLNAGSYYLRASSNGNHVTEWWADPASTPGITQAHAVTVAEGEIVAGINFQLDSGPVDLDTDGDGIIDNEDNCPFTPNSDQLDYDSDTVGDLCDNCLDIYNPGQEDSNLNGTGDVCEITDFDGPITNNVITNSNPVVINSLFMLSATVDDIGRGNSDIQTAEYNFNNSGWFEMDPVDSYDSPTEDVVHEFYAPATAGIYQFCVRGTDMLGHVGDPACTLLVVYDPDGGFVTGGGWISSQPGAYLPDPSLYGKANFGFVSKYKKGARTPSGNTEFKFQAGNLNFHSATYDWLVVTGSDYAKFKGIGTINGAGSYKFMIWAGDGTPDTFRIRIWEEDELTAVETVIYDNGYDQPIESGNIVIHTK